jgi:hypothetical protein
VQLKATLSLWPFGGAAGVILTTGLKQTQYSLDQVKVSTLEDQDEI